MAGIVYASIIAAILITGMCRTCGFHWRPSIIFGIGLAAGLGASAAEGLGYL